MDYLEETLQKIIRDPENGALLDAFMKQAKIEHGSAMEPYFPSFLARLSGIGISDDYAVSTLQVGVLNYFVINCGWRYAMGEGKFSDQIDAILAFLSNDLEKSSEHFHKYSGRKWNNITIEYYFRLLAISSSNQETVLKMQEIGETVELVPVNLGIYLLPATVSATLSQFDVANDLLRQPYAKLIRPNLEKFYPPTARFEKSTDRFSYKSDSEQLEIYKKYYQEMGQFKSPYQNDSMMINYVFALETMKYLRSTDHPPETVLNFGSTFGWFESVLSKNFKNINIVGYDESNVSKTMNDQYFHGNENLHFTSGEFWETVKPINRDKSMLVHCRTGTLFQFDDLVKFYQDLYNSGFTSIGIAEHFRFDMRSGRFLDQNSPDFSSIVKTGTGVTHLHNYKKALSSAGYHIVSEKMVPDVSYRGINTLALGEYVYVAIAESKGIPAAV